MKTLGRQTLLWMIPINLVVVAWVWIGRIVFGVDGWFLLIFMVTVVPVLFLGLLLTTILALTQDGRPRSLTPAQAWAQLVTWLGLIVVGAFMVDFGDTDDSQVSLLTQAFGYSDDLYNLSFLIAVAGAGVAVTAYVVLLALLTFARRDARILDPATSRSHDDPGARPDGLRTTMRT